MQDLDEIITIINKDLHQDVNALLQTKYNKISVDVRNDEGFERTSVM